MENTSKHSGSVALKYITVILCVLCVTVIYYIIFGRGVTTLNQKDVPSFLGSELGAISHLSGSKAIQCEHVEVTKSDVPPGLGRWMPGRKYDEMEQLIPHCHGSCNNAGKYVHFYYVYCMVHSTPKRSVYTLSFGE